MSSVSGKKKKGISRWFRRRSKNSFGRSVLGSDPALFDFSSVGGSRSATVSPAPPTELSWPGDHERDTARDLLMASSELNLKVVAFEGTIAQLRSDNEKLRHQVTELEDESSDLSYERTELRSQIDKQRTTLERQMAELKRDMDSVGAQLAATEAAKEQAEEEVRKLNKDKRECEASKKESEKRVVAAEVRAQNEVELGEHLTEKLKNMWVLKERETHERKVLTNLLKSAESFAKSQEEVIFELLYKIKELKRELIDKDVELAGLRQRCISMDRIDFLDRELEMDVSFDYNKNELSFDELDLVSSPFSPEMTSSFAAKTPRKLFNVEGGVRGDLIGHSWAMTPTRSALVESCLDSGFADSSSILDSFKVAKDETKSRVVFSPLPRRTVQNAQTPSTELAIQPRSLFELFKSICSDSTMFVYLLFFKLVAFCLLVAKLPYTFTSKLICTIGTATGLVSHKELQSRRRRGSKAIKRN